MNPPYELKEVSGTAFILFIDDEIEVFEQQATQFCQFIIQMYQCQAWSCYLWDAILIDFDNSACSKPALHITEYLQEVPFPSHIVHDMCEKIKVHCVQHIPTVLKHSGYYMFQYSEFI